MLPSVPLEKVAAIGVVYQNWSIAGYHIVRLEASRPVGLAHGLDHGVEQRFYEWSSGGHRRAVMVDSDGDSNLSERRW
ncbi:hypothetical protein [Luedemannella helvata]